MRLLSLLNIALSAFFHCDVDIAEQGVERNTLLVLHLRRICSFLLCSKNHLSRITLSASQSPIYPDATTGEAQHQPVHIPMMTVLIPHLETDNACSHSTRIAGHI